MASPFPGMDPYLEMSWRDVHARIIIYLCDDIQEQLGGVFKARVEERLVVDDLGTEEDEGGSIYPDARIFQPARTGGRTRGAVRPHTSNGGMAVVEPIRLSVAPDYVETFIRVIDRAGHLITVIELLSPTNKRAGAAGEQYRQKRNALYHGGVNFVEIDLTRGGHRKFLRDIPEKHRATYEAMVFRFFEPAFEFYPMPLERPLPDIRIPLKKGVPDVYARLQMVVARAYANGGYEDLDYASPLRPPLKKADEAFARKVLGRRKHDKKG